MILEFHNKFQAPVSTNATRLVIRASDGTPIAIVTEPVPGHIRHYRVTDPDFEKELRLNGVYSTVILQDLKPGIGP
jgi:hypothetical protein